jgi:hypothetical protein
VDGRWAGLSVGTSLTFVGRYIANYESTTHRYLAYPSYALVGVNANYTWKRTKTSSHNFGLAVRNALDRDLLAALARPGAGREISASYSWVF